MTDRPIPPCSPITRDEARAAWAQAGLTTGALTSVHIDRLHMMLDKALRGSRLIKGYSMHKGRKVGLHAGGWLIALTCKAYYFKYREAVTFNDNGFVGFAGWADDGNVQPILRAFVDWVRWMEGGAA